MAGKITIYDNTTIKYEFQIVKSVMHNFEIQIDKYSAPGDVLPYLDHVKTVVHVITVDFELVDQGAYAGGSAAGSTGTIYKQRDLLQANLKAQAASHTYYQLAEEDDVQHDTTNSNAWLGLPEKILITREDKTQPKMTGTLTFIEASDVANF